MLTIINNFFKIALILYVEQQILGDRKWFLKWPTYPTKKMLWHLIYL